MSRPLFSEDNRDPHSTVLQPTPAYDAARLTPPSSTPAWVGVGHKAVTGPDCIECGKPQASYKCLKCREDVCTSLVTDCIARHTDACADREEARLAAIRARMPFRPDPLEHDFVRAPGGRCSVCDYDEPSHARSDMDLIHEHEGRPSYCCAEGCSERICRACAGSWIDRTDYMFPFALCQECFDAGEYKRQMQDWRNDSGV